MLKNLLVLSITFFGLLGLADEVKKFPNDALHSAPYCSPTDVNICVHVMFFKPITTAEEGQFIIHANPVSPGLVTQLTADIWMDMPGHGHGSAPLIISALTEPNHFKITNAWFVMTGPWLVRVSFKLNDQVYNINIPVLVTE